MVEDMPEEPPGDTPIPLAGYIVSPGTIFLFPRPAKTND